MEKNVTQALELKTPTHWSVIYNGNGLVMFVLSIKNRAFQRRRPSGDQGTVVSGDRVFHVLSIYRRGMCAKRPINAPVPPMNANANADILFGYLSSN